MLKKLSIFIIFLVFLTGCEKNRVELLTDRADAYNRSLRWSSLTAAGALIAPENRRTLINALSEELSARKIVDYSIIDLSVDKAQTQGSVLVEFSYYNITDQNLLTRQELQTWEFNKSQGNWFIAKARSLPNTTRPVISE